MKESGPHGPAMNEEIIKSSGNPRVKKIRKLMKSSAERNSAGLFPVEGIRMAREIPAELIRELYFSESAVREGLTAELADIYSAAGAAPVILSDDIFRSISDTKTPQGVLALVRKVPYTFADVIRSARPVIVLECLQDPGNMGTILRSLEAAGGGGLICDAACTDIYSLKTIRATMGTLFRVPHITVEDLAGTVRDLKRNGYRIYAAHLSGEEYSTAVRYEEKSAFLIGNEGRGLTDETAALADQLIKIPMEGSVESLNAAVAASLLLYEVKRQLR